MNQHEPRSIVVGVDVGGPKKGFHAVALQDGQYRAQLSTLMAAEVAAWCRRLKASVEAEKVPGASFSSRYNPATPFPPLGPSGKDR